MTGAMERIQSDMGSAQKIWEDHPANPFNWPESKKWTIILMAGSVSLLAGLNATTPSQNIAQTFHVDDSRFPNSFWLTTVWNSGAAIGPMVGLPLLENFGVRNGFLVIVSHFLEETIAAKRERIALLYCLHRHDRPSGCRSELRDTAGHSGYCRIFRRRCPKRNGTIDSRLVAR